jgi:tRNA-dihydrouridine synthase B
MINFKIKDIPIRHRGILAPMQEYSHLPFRLLCKDYNAGLTYTEMVNIHHVLEYREDLSKLDLLDSVKNEGPVSVQLAGDLSLSKCIDAAHLIDNYDSFDIIDFNLGCPSIKIVNSNTGAYNLKQLDKVYPILKEIIDTCNKPITVKLRLGFNEDILDDMLFKFEKLGVSAIALHGRLATDHYNVPSKISSITPLVKDLSIPFIYNGDVNETNLGHLEQFEALMVARESLGNPFIFKQIDYFTKNNILLEKDTSFEALFSFLEYVKKYPISFAKFKVSLIPFFKNKKGSSRIRELISKAKDFKEISDILKEL